MHKFFAKTEYLGKKVIFLPQCHSTNEEARQLMANESVKEGTTIITADQTKGKGQRGNNWESEPDKNITFSIIINPGFLVPNDQFQLHIITTLAIYEVLFKIVGKNLKIKWPNDIYFLDRKLGGILIENSIRQQRIDDSIIGIGINVNQIHFQNKNATSLQEITLELFDTHELIELIIINLEKRYDELKNGETDLLQSQYLRRMFRFDKMSKFKKGNRTFDGIISGIDSKGRLIISENGTDYTFDFKEVEFVI